MNKKVSVILVALMVIAIMPSSLISTAQAKITETNPGPGYTEYYGTMGRANFYVLIPDDWTSPLGDGMLLMMCRAAMWDEDPRDSITDYPLAMG